MHAHIYTHAHLEMRVIVINEAMNKVSSLKDSRSRITSPEQMGGAGHEMAQC